MKSVDKYLAECERKAAGEGKCCLLCARERCPILRAWQEIVCSPKAMLTFYCSEYKEPTIVEAQVTP